MKLTTAMFTVALALAPAVGFAQALPPNNSNSTTFAFPLTVSPGAATFLPNAKGVVIPHTFGNVENLQVIISGLPPNTDFVLFIIQVPNAPFGLAWYNGDILTDDTGTGVINAVGRFNIGTFIVSLGAVPSRDVFPSPPAVLANSTTGAVTNGPVQIYHLGIWFNTPEDAVKAGCPGTATTFTSDHRAGIRQHSPITRVLCSLSHNSVSRGGECPVDRGHLYHDSVSLRGQIAPDYVDPAFYRRGSKPSDSRHRATSAPP